MRKRWPVGWVFLWTIGQLACAPWQEIERFEVKGDQSVDIEGQSLVAELRQIPVDAIGDALSQEISQTFANKGVDRNDVDSFSPKQALIEITAPLDRDGQPLQDLRFLERVEFSVSSSGNDAALVAKSVPDAFTAGIATYAFAVDENQNLRDHLVADAMTLTVDALARERPVLGCTVRFAVTFIVDVNPAGLLD